MKRTILQRLGLAIVNILAHMHGSIHVTSQQGKGSKLSLHLPIDCRKNPGGSVAGGPFPRHLLRHHARIMGRKRRGVQKRSGVRCAKMACDAREWGAIRIAFTLAFNCIGDGVPKDF